MANNETELKTKDIRFLPDVHQEYSKLFVQMIGFENVLEVRLTGSIGRNDFNLGSDMDTFLVVNGSRTLVELAAMSEAEMEARRFLARDLGMPNLARHRSTLLNQEEYYLYEQLFATRLGVERRCQENTFLKLGDLPAQKAPHPSDLVVTFNEFEELYQKAVDGNGMSPHKYVRRLFREMVYYRDGVRISFNSDVDRQILLMCGSDEEVVRQAREFRESIVVSPEAVKARGIAHHLMFTLEKVRWELIYGLLNPADYEDWRLGIKRHYGFYPQEIVQLVEEAEKELGVDGKAIKEAAIALSKQPYDQDTIVAFHELHSQWMLNSCKIAFERSEHG